jgi:hypothetical protein
MAWNTSTEGRGSRLAWQPPPRHSGYPATRRRGEGLKLCTALLPLPSGERAGVRGQPCVVSPKKHLSHGTGFELSERTLCATAERCRCCSVGLSRIGCAPTDKQIARTPTRIRQPHDAMCREAARAVGLMLLTFGPP